MSKSQAPIIYLAFANNNISPLNKLKEEYRSIRKCLVKLEDEKKIRLRGHPDAHLEDIKQDFFTYKNQISIFHFAGHSDNKTLLFEDSIGYAEGVAGLLSNQKKLNLVFLNGCNNIGQVDAFFKNGAKVLIATDFKISDNHATKFSKWFYTCLSESHSIKEAYKYSINTLKSECSDYYEAQIEPTKYHRGLALKSAKENLSTPWNLFYSNNNYELLNWKIKFKIVSFELIIKNPFKDFSENDQTKILNALSELLDMDEGEINIKRVLPGSTKLVMDLPEDKAKELIEHINKGKLAEVGALMGKILQIEEIKEKKEKQQLKTTEITSNILRKPTSELYSPDNIYNIHGIDWEFIIETIRNEKCILFIGPELFKDENGFTLEEQMSRYLEVDSNPDIQNFYQEDGLFLFTNGTKKTKSYYKIKNFYNQSFPRTEAILEKLAHIPFHFIISITPDKKCFNTFTSLGFYSRFAFYWKKQITDNSMSKPTIENPIIYNLLGSIDTQESLILTHDDLFDYFESVFQENNMPEKLKLNLKDAHNFIFLGLDFEKWYMQLLLRILYLHNDKYEFMRYAANQKISEELKAFCFQQFKIEFVPNQINEFVDELFKQCKKAELVRQNENWQSSASERINNLLTQDKIEEALKELKDFLEGFGDLDSDLTDNLTLLTSQFRGLNRDIDLGVKDSREVELKSNRIRFSLIELLNKVKRLE